MAAATTGYNHKSNYYKTRTSSNNNNYVEHVSNYRSTVVQSVNCHYKFMTPPQVVDVVYYDQLLMPTNCNKVLAADQIRTRPFYHSTQNNKMTTITTATPPHTTATTTEFDAGKSNHEKYRRPRVLNHREAAELYGGKFWES